MVFFEKVENSVIYTKMARVKVRQLVNSDGLPFLDKVDENNWKLENYFNFITFKMCFTFYLKRKVYWNWNPDGGFKLKNISVSYNDFREEAIKVKYTKNNLI